MTIAFIIAAALLAAETLFVFFALPRAAQVWQWQGYWLGRKDQRNGTPVPARMLPPRTGER